MIEIAIGGNKNRNLQFLPIGRKLRGLFDLNQCAEPLARMESGKWPRPIPGVRVIVDPVNRTAAIVEPLHDTEHAATRDRIAAMGLSLPPQREEFTDIDSNTWLYWLRRAVEGGVASIIKGTFPGIDEASAQKSFVTTPVKDKRDSLIEKLVAILYASLPAEKQKQVAGMIGE